MPDEEQYYFYYYYFIIIIIIIYVILISLRRIQGNIGRDVTILDESKTSPILSHRVPIFPCILRKQEIQYYYYYLDHPSEMKNSLSDQKILKIDETGNKFQRFGANTTKPHSFTTSLIEVHDVTIEYAC